jgi:hypothetical protein
MHGMSISSHERSVDTCSHLPYTAQPIAGGARRAEDNSVPGQAHSEGDKGGKNCRTYDEGGPFHAGHMSPLGSCAISVMICRS